MWARALNTVLACQIHLGASSVCSSCGCIGECSGRSHRRLPFQVVEDLNCHSPVELHFRCKGDVGNASHQVILVHIVHSVVIPVTGRHIPRPDVESLEEQCLKIQSKALSGKDDQAIVSLDRGKFITHIKSYEFGNTLIKIRNPTSNTSPAYIFVKEGSTLWVRIYLSKDYSDGVMVILNGAEKVVYVSLAECHVLPIQEKSDVRREVGLMLSFTRAIRHLYFSIIMALNLDPIQWNP